MQAAPDLMYKKAVCAFELRDFYGVAADTGRAIKVRGGEEDGDDDAAASCCCWWCYWCP